MTEKDPDPYVDAIFQEFGDLFGGFFDGARTKGPDLRMELELDREDLIRGKRAVTIERFIGCARCHGSGRLPAESDPCLGCGGEGKRQVRQGAFLLTTTCSDCRGSGSARECPRCTGTGGETHEETLQVTIPPQIQDGQTLRLSGKGSDLSDGKGPGDLYLAIRIPSAGPATIPVEESAGTDASEPSIVPWVVLAIAVVAILIAANLLA